MVGRVTHSKMDKVKFYRLLSKPASIKRTRQMRYTVLSIIINNNNRLYICVAITEKLSSLEFNSECSIESLKYYGYVHLSISFNFIYV